MKKHRILSERTKREIREAFRIYAGSGVPEEQIVRMCADHAIGLLQLSEDSVKDWYEESK